MLLQSLFLPIILTPFSLSAPLTKRAFSNGPVITSNFPDPAFIQVNGTYYVFATTDGKSNIPTATSPDFNTWTVTGQECPPHTSNLTQIDGISLGGGGTCGNGNGSYSTPFMLQPVGADGVTPSGPAVQILDRDMADGPLVEAPYLILVNGTYVLFFSSNWHNGPSYDTSYATASAVRGPYTKASTLLLQSGDDGGALYSLGGASVDLAGTKMVFHADEVAGDDAVRQMWTAGIVVEGTTFTIS